MSLDSTRGSEVNLTGGAKVGRIYKAVIERRQTNRQKQCDGSSSATDWRRRRPSLSLRCRSADDDDEDTKKESIDGLIAAGQYTGPEKIPTSLSQQSSRRKKAIENKVSPIGRWSVASDNSSGDGSNDKLTDYWKRKHHAVSVMPVILWCNMLFFY
jgi:hypothetical protein